MADDDFETLLRLHPLGDDTFRNEPLVPGHLYGGYTLALALRAAALTVGPGLRPSSLHAVFPSAGNSGEPLELHVAAVRDGRSSALRQVTARQAANTPLLVTTDFAPEPEGADWEGERRPLPAPPEEIEPDRSLLLAMDPVEFRPAGGNRADSGGAVLAPLHPYWARPRTTLPDDPALHAAVVAFTSDYMMVAAAQVPGRLPPPGVRVASVNHSVWFHASVDADAWLLYSAEPVRVRGDRSLVHGTVRTRQGDLVASVAQEVLTSAPRP
jgi:acyl-CoA thioesterase-2